MHYYQKQQNLLRRVEVLYAKANGYFGRDFPLPDVKVNGKGTDGGKAYLDLNQLKFNKVLFDENYDLYMSNYIPHEVAHLIAHQMYGSDIKPHGDEWKSVMRDVFGVEPTTTHQMDTRRAANLPYIYTCECPDRIIPISKRVHTLMQEGDIRTCKKCRAQLLFSHEEDPKSGKVLHVASGMAIPYQPPDIGNLLLACDADWEDISTFSERLAKLLSGVEPKSITLANTQYRQSAVAVWLQRHEVPFERRYDYDFKADPEKLLNNINHAIAISTGQNERINLVMAAVKAKGGIATRLLKI